jgi:hypothetical protein
VALDEAYRSVGQFRLEQILNELTALAGFADVSEGFSADAVDRNTQILWLWLDTFQGDVSHSNDVQKLSKALGLNKQDFKNLKRLLTVEEDIYTLKPPQEVNLGLLARNLVGTEEVSAREREGREADVWDERKFPGFLGAAVWNAIGLMAGGDGGAPRSGGAAAVAAQLRLRRRPQFPRHLCRHPPPAPPGVWPAAARRSLARGDGASGLRLGPGPPELAEVSRGVPRSRQPPAPLRRAGRPARQ